MKQIKLFAFLIVWCMCFKAIASGFLDIFTAWNKPNIKRDIVYDFVGLVGRHNYPAKEYKVKTTDGYKLLIHRIPGSPENSEQNRKPVIFLQHGMLGSSDMWVIGGPHRDLAFLLADAGYDVWLGNSRGNVYSRKHDVLNPDSDTEFWEFSFHEIGIYDLSAVIDFILDKTNQSSLTYVGHSMGATESLILLSEKPQYNKKIHLAIYMAPVYRWRNLRNFIKFMKQHLTLLQKITLLIGMDEVLPLSRVVGQKASTVCNEGSVLQELCVDIVQYISGFSKDVMDTDLLAESFSYFPAGSSRKSFLHYNQNMEYGYEKGKNVRQLISELPDGIVTPGEFQMYDYGLIHNLMIYHQPFPPAYDLSKITIPAYIFYGMSDAIAAPEEALDLSKALKNATTEAVPNKECGHLDFFWAKEVKSLLHDRVMEIIVKHTPKKSDGFKTEL